MIKYPKIPKGADLSRIHESLRDKACPIGMLTGHPDNPRLHPESNRKAINGSLSKYSQRKPIVANQTESGLRIEAGHGVYQEMLALGAQYVAVTIVEDSAIDELGYMLADNRSGDLSSDDPEKLAPIIRQLIKAGEDVEEIGWDDEAIKQLIGDVDDGDDEDDSGDDDAPIDKAAELQKKWSTERGQIWEIPSKSVPGKCHRVMCGDCRESADVSALLDGQKVNVAFTSPPYASQRKYDEESGFLPIKPDVYVEWFEAVQANVRQHLAEDGSWFVNIKEHCEDGQRHLYVKDLTIAHVRRWGWKWIEEYIWKHGGTPKAVQKRFKGAWEPVFQFTMSENFRFRPDAVRHASDSVPVGDGANTAMRQGRGDALGRDKEINAGLAYPSNVISIGKNSEALGHGAAFPVALPTFFIKAYSDPGAVIFDPFLGSGTTMIAAEKESRVCCGMEISPKYLGVILERATNAGLEPRLVGV